MSQMTIGEVAAQVGVRTSAIRFYERKGLLPSPQRINGQRRYESGVVQQMRVIQLAQKAGFTIGEIRQLLHGFPVDTPPSTRWQTLANPKLEEIRALQAKLDEMKVLLERSLYCHCVTLNDCASGQSNAELPASCGK